MIISSMDNNRLFLKSKAPLQSDGFANSEISIPETVNSEFETSILDKIPATDINIAVTLEATRNAEKESVVKIS